MKRLFILSVFLMVSGLALFAQAPPNPPNDPSNSGGTGPVGGGAPIGEGIVILSVMAAAYGGKKAFNKPRLFKR